MVRRKTILKNTPMKSNTFTEELFEKDYEHSEADKAKAAELESPIKPPLSAKNPKSDQNNPKTKEILESSFESVKVKKTIEFKITTVEDEKKKLEQSQEVFQRRPFRNNTGMGIRINEIRSSRKAVSRSLYHPSTTKPYAKPWKNGNKVSQNQQNQQNRQRSNQEENDHVDTEEEDEQPLSTKRLLLNHDEAKKRIKESFLSNNEKNVLGDEDVEKSRNGDKNENKRLSGRLLEGSGDQGTQENLKNGLNGQNGGFPQNENLQRNLVESRDITIIEPLYSSRCNNLNDPSRHLGLSGPMSQKPEKKFMPSNGGGKEPDPDADDAGGVSFGEKNDDGKVLGHLKKSVYRLNMSEIEHMEKKTDTFSLLRDNKGHFQKAKKGQKK